MKYWLTILLIFATIAVTGCGAQSAPTQTTHSNPIDKTSPDAPNQ